MVGHLFFWETALFDIVFFLLYGSRSVTSVPGEGQIVCFGKLPPYLDPVYGFYGSPLSMVTPYDGLTSLCASSEQSRLIPVPKVEGEANPEEPFWQEVDPPRGPSVWNIGIICEKSQMIPRQFASADKQEQQQWEATLQYCLDRCICIETYMQLALCLKDSLGSSYATILRGALTRANGGTQRRKTCKGLSAQECVRSLKDLSCDSSTLQATTDFHELPLRPVSTQNKDNDGQCGAHCSNSNFHCRDRGVGCRCLARQLVQGTFNQWSCGIPGLSTAISSTNRYGGRKMKRSVEYACPCNQSYVSQSCCEAVDGIVHEPSWLKMGSLKM